MGDRMFINGEEVMPSFDATALVLAYCDNCRQPINLTADRKIPGGLYSKTRVGESGIWKHISCPRPSNDRS
jgi:hypothetical protein